MVCVRVHGVSCVSMLCYFFFFYRSVWPFSFNFRSHHFISILGNEQNITIKYRSHFSHRHLLNFWTVGRSVRYNRSFVDPLVWTSIFIIVLCAVQFFSISSQFKSKTYLQHTFRLFPLLKHQTTITNAQHTIILYKYTKEHWKLYELFRIPSSIQHINLLC